MRSHNARIGIAALVLGIVLGGARRAGADLVYDNGPLGPTNVAWAISRGFSISDSFTLSGPATLTEARAALLIQPYSYSPGDVPSSVDWSIGSSPLGHDLGSGTSTLANVFLGKSDFSYSDGSRFNVYESSFSIGGTLAAGTYYLTLQNVKASDGGSETTLWSENDGPSTGYTATAFVDGKVHVIGSEDFQLYSAAVPEPAALAQLGIGVVATLGYLSWRRGGVSRRRR